MMMTAHIRTTTDELWLAPITLQVVADWEKWAGKAVSDLAEPTAMDMGYLCYRAAFYAGHISRATSLKRFMQRVVGWEILNTTTPVSEQVENWLRHTTEDSE